MTPFDGISVKEKRFKEIYEKFWCYNPVFKFLAFHDSPSSGRDRMQRLALEDESWIVRNFMELRVFWTLCFTFKEFTCFPIFNLFQSEIKVNLSKCAINILAYLNSESTLFPFSFFESFFI